MRFPSCAQLDGPGGGGHARGPGPEVADELVGAAADDQPAALLVVLYLPRAAARQAPPRGDQLSVEPGENGVRSAGELGALKRRRVLGIGDLAAELGEGLKLAPAALTGGGGDLLVDVVGEELEGGELAVLLAH